MPTRRRSNAAALGAPGYAAVRNSAAVRKNNTAMKILGIFVHRLNLILNGLSYATIQYPPGVSVGVDQGLGSSFALSHWYIPTAVEWLVVAGVLAFGALVFTVSVLILPMQEPADH